jgi:hypothetical protein
MTSNRPSVPIDADIDVGSWFVKYSAYERPWMGSTTMNCATSARPSAKNPTPSLTLGSGGKVSPSTAHRAPIMVARSTVGISSTSANRSLKCRATNSSQSAYVKILVAHASRAFNMTRFEFPICTGIEYMKVC